MRGIRQQRHRVGSQSEPDLQNDKTQIDPRAERKRPATPRRNTMAVMMPMVVSMLMPGRKGVIVMRRLHDQPTMARALRHWHTRFTNW
jgi:hypothetical protein